MTLIPIDKAGSSTVDATRVQVVDGSGVQITSFGGGTQYTEGDTDASITGTALLMEGAGNALVPLQGTAADGLLVNLGANNDISGTVTANLSATDNAVLDDIAANQTDASQKTQIVDGSGNVIGATSNALDVNIKSGSSAGTQYTEGDTDASITGTAILWEDTGDTLTTVSAAKPLPVTATLDTTGLATAANQSTIIGHVDGIETVLGTIDTDTGAIATSADSIDGKITACDTTGLALESGGNLDEIASTVKAEDSGFSNGDKGVAILGVRNEDGDDFSGTDKDYIPIALDAKGHVFVRNSDEIFSVDTELTTADLDTGAGTDTRAVVGLVGAASGGGQLIPGSTADGLLVNLGTNNDVVVSATNLDIRDLSSVSDSVSAVQAVAANLNCTEASAATIATNTGNCATSLGNLDNSVDGNYLNVNANIAGTDITGGAGAVAASTPRVTLASDDPAVTALQLIDNAISGAGFNITQMNGVNVTMGNGASGTGVQRVTIASDSTGQCIAKGPVAVDAAISTNAPVIHGGRASTATPSAVSADNDVQAMWLTRNGATVVDGGIAHDAADAGSSVKIGAKAIAALSGATLVAAADRTDLYADLDGAQLVRENAAIGDYVSGNANNTDGSSTACIAAGAAGIKHYLTDVTLTNTSTSNIYVEIKDGATTKWTFPVPANGGVTHSFKTPIAGSAATAWNFDPSAATSTVYCSMSAFKSKV